MNIALIRSLIATGFVGGLLFTWVASTNTAEAQEKEAAKEVKIVRTPAELAAMEALRKQGALVLELAQNDPRLEVSYLQMIEKFGDGHLSPLKEIKGVVRLNLRGQPVTDDLLKNLEPLKDLTHLHLEKTKITDKGLISVKGLSNLEYLNIYGTGVTDGGLKNLEDLKKLRAVYVWQTKVTKEGAANLKKVLTKTEVNRGLDDLPPLPKMEEKKTEPKKAEQKKGDQKKADQKKADAKKAIEKKAEEKKGDNKK